jgi:hypothetical protein
MNQPTQPQCSNCGKPMRFNVPRMGPDGGYVHADTGLLTCGDGVATYTVISPDGPPRHPCGAFAIPAHVTVSDGVPAEIRKEMESNKPNMKTEDARQQLIDQIGLARFIDGAVTESREGKFSAHDANLHSSISAIVL